MVANLLVAIDFFSNFQDKQTMLILVIWFYGYYVFVFNSTKKKTKQVEKKKAL
jgi:cbb3-type cytochrome oxidase subunit 3